VENLTYKIYLANPEIRDRIEREVRRARAEAFDRHILTPLLNACSRLSRWVPQVLVLILTLANHRFYSPGWISGTEFNRSTQPRS